MKFVNLTPHEINIVGYGIIPPSGIIARVNTIQRVVDNIVGIDVVETFYGEITGIPEPEDDTIYITSSLVAGFAKRDDVLAPDTGGTAVRENGQIVGVTRLQSFSGDE